MAPPHLLPGLPPGTFPHPPFCPPEPELLMERALPQGPLQTLEKQAQWSQHKSTQA